MSKCFFEFHDGKYLLLFVSFLICGSSSTLAQEETSGENAVTGRQKYSIAASLNGGFGFEKHDLFETEDDKTATISPGGGAGLSLTFGILLTPSVELDVCAAFQSSSLSKNLKNADASFMRYYFNSTLKYVIPAKNEDYAWKIGGGIGYYLPQNLSIEWEDMSNIADGDIEMSYNGSVGFHAVGEFEMRLGSKNWFIVYRIMYYYTSYEYSSSNSSGVTVVDPGDFEKLNGSTFNLGVTFGKYF